MKNFNKVKSLLILSILIFFYNCNSENNINEETTVEDIITISILNNQDVTFTSMKVSAELTYESESEIIERGIVWSLDFNPTISDSKIVENSNSFTSSITNLHVGKTYYYRAFVSNDNGTTYSEEKSFETSSFGGTSWEIATSYGTSFAIHSKVDFHQDNTTKYDELDLPMQCPGCFITFGSWSIEGNVLTYIWEGTNPDLSNATYVYTGTISGMTIQGTYKHVTSGVDNWSATIL